MTPRGKRLQRQGEQSNISFFVNIPGRADKRWKVFHKVRGNAASLKIKAKREPERIRKRIVRLERADIAEIETVNIVFQAGAERKEIPSANLRRLIKISRAQRNNVVIYILCTERRLYCLRKRNRILTLPRRDKRFR